MAETIELPGPCRALIGALDDGFCVIEAIVDESGQPIDYRFLEINAAFAAQTGLTGAVGRRMRDLAPARVEPWFELCGRIVRTGMPERFEHRDDAAGRTCEVQAFPLGQPGPRLVGIIVRDIDARRAQAPAHDGEVLYQTLFERMQDGCCICAQVADDPVDFRYLATNPAFERHAGQAPMGRTMRAMGMAIDDAVMSTYARVAATGTPESFTTHDPSLDRWFDVEVDAADRPGRICLTFRDVSRRERAQAALRASQARQAFLLGLSDALRPLADPVDIMSTTSRMVGMYLQVGRCGYGEVPPPRDVLVVERDWTDGRMDSLRGRWPLAMFGEEIIGAYRAGTTVVIEDALADARARGIQDAIAAVGHLRSSIAVPLVKDSELSAFFYVQDIVARQWTQDEKALVHEVAERTWSAVERARTEADLRRSESRLRGVLESMAEGFALLGADFTILDVNDETLRLDGRSRDELVGRSHWEAFPGTEASELGRMYRRVLHERVPGTLQFHYTWPGGREAWVDVRAYPTFDGGIACFWRDVTERMRTEAALAESEQRYRSLFESMGEAYAVIDVLRDAQGAWRDFRFVEVNAAFMQHTGMPYPVGRTATELLGVPNPRWAELYGQVLDHGQPLRVEEGEPTLGRTFDLNIFCLDPARDRVAVLFTDITARKRAEAALRASEERKTFLLELGDALRTVSGTDALLEVAARRLGERLAASRVLFAEFDHANGVAHVFSGWSADGATPFPTVMQLAEYEGPVLDDLREGRIVRVDDIADPAHARADLATIARVGVGALLSIPLYVAGRLTANISVHQADARHWTDDDVAITQEVAERVWAEVVRARAQAALRESDARRIAVADAAPALIWEIDARGATYVNCHYLEFVGAGFDDIAGMAWAKFVHPDDLDAYARVYQRAFENRGPFEHELRLLRADGQYRWMRITGCPLGTDRYVGACLDITEAREAAERLEADRERQAFLLELGDALRSEPCADAVVACALQMLLDRLGLDRCYVGVYRLDDDRAELPYQLARAGLPPLPESIRLSDFPEAFQVALDRTLVIEDVAHDPGLSARDRDSIAALGFGALVAATLRRGAGRPLWAIVAVSAGPRRWTPGEIALIEEVTERAWSAMERARTEAALSESEQRLRLGAEVARFALWDWNVRTGEVTWSDEHFRMLGYEVGEVVPSYAAWAARVHPDDLADTEAALAEARRTRTEYVREFRSLHPDGSVHWLSARGRFFHDDAGEPVRMIGAMLDTTERRQWEDRQQVLVAELQHRTRNIMGVVRAMFERTRRDSPDTQTLSAKYADRLNALARVQGLLSRLEDGDRITFDELIHTELSAMGAIDGGDAGARVTLDGPAGVRMRSATVQTFALALHELATNAAKYGALAQPGGRLEVRWRLKQEDPPRLCIEWKESGVTMPPSGATPAGSGYGRELIERALPYQLHAQTRYELGADGVHCVIEVPVPGR